MSRDTTKAESRSVARCTVLLFGIALILTGAPAAIAEVERTSIVASDDFPADVYLDPGVLTCPGGEVVWTSPAEPTCPQSGQLQLRDALGYTCYEAVDENGTPEPRFSGVMVFTFNASLGPDHSGTVWGEWKLVPSEVCDHTLVDGAAVFWTGLWEGQRNRICSGASCIWVGDLRAIGKGEGGELEGTHILGRELLTTLTPLPLPYELLGVCPPSGPCPPEGQLTAVITDTR